MLVICDLGHGHILKKNTCLRSETFANSLVWLHAELNSKHLQDIFEYSLVSYV